MFSVNVKSTERNGVYSARSVTLEKNSMGQAVEIVGEDYKPTRFDIKSKGDVWVMNEVGKTVAHYQIENGLTTNKNVASEES